MSLLTLANPKGGRPLNNITFSVDPELSTVFFKLGYISCSNCGCTNSVGVDKDQLELFLKSDYNTLEGIGLHPVKSIRNRLGSFLGKVSKRINTENETETKNRQIKQLKNEVWITQ